FKLQLGVPTDLNIELDDEAFRPINEHFRRYEDLYREFEASSDEATGMGGPEWVAKLRSELLRIFLTSGAVKGTAFQRDIEARGDACPSRPTEESRKRRPATGEERQKLRDRKTDLEATGRTLDRVEEQRRAALESEIDLGEFEASRREYESKPWEKLPEPQK